MSLGSTHSDSVRKLAYINKPLFKFKYLNLPFVVRSTKLVATTAFRIVFAVLQTLQSMMMSVNDIIM